MANRVARTLLGGAAALVLLLGATAPARAQGGTEITGRVSNETGVPIPFATISIEGTQIGAQSGTDGKYTLMVPASRRGAAVLTIRLIGFKMAQQNVTLTGASLVVNWQLTAVATELSGVIVTALSVQREKSTIGTSQQAVQGSELTRVPESNVIAAMSGKVSGVAINQTGNMGGSSRIVIRGANSILGENQPLFIVDGMPIFNTSFSTASAGGGRDYGTAISDLNADDIASMTVLKGPNAAAIYGAQASRGAVVITTKSGRGAAPGTQFSFSSRMTMDQLSIFPTYQNSYGQGFGGQFQYVDGAGSGTNDGADESWGPRLNGQLIDQFSGQQQPWIAHPNNVRDYFRNGSTISNSIAVVTSARGMGARLSLTKDQVTGIVPNASMGKVTATASGNASVGSKLVLSGSLQYVQDDALNRTENGYTEGNPWMTFTWFGRQVDVAALKNQYYNVNSPYGFADGSLYNWNDNYHRNPWWQASENPAPDSRDRVFGQLTADYQFTSWLSGQVRTGTDAYTQNTAEYFAKGNIDRASPSYNGGFNIQTSHARQTSTSWLAIAKHQFGLFELQGTGGGAVSRTDQDAKGMSTNGILVQGIYNVSNAGIVPTINNSETHRALNSAFGSALITYDRFFTIEATGRNDWSSTLPKANASYFYPSVSAALVITDLFPSLTSNNWLTYAKLRGSYAQVGLDAQPYALQTLYNGSSNKFSGLALYSLNNTSANPNLKPERTTGSEAGIEASLFKDRITFDATYYTKQTKDLLMNLTIAPATGFSSTQVNAGQISNRGIEFLITAKPIVRPGGLNWTTSFNFTRNRNKVDDLAPGLSTIILAQQWGTNIEARKGQPYGVIFGYGWQRDSATHQLLLVDGLPQRNTTKMILGNVNPDWVGGWSNEFRYKNYALNLLFDIRHGGQNFSIGNWWGMYAGILGSTLKGRENDWNDPGLVVKGIDKATGQPNTTVVTAEDYGHNLYPTVEPAIFNTGFVKLRELRISWDAPSSVATKLRLSQLNVALVGRNLLTWTKFPNYDPENSTNAGNGGQGFDMGAMPTTRQFGFNVRITP